MPESGGWEVGGEIVGLPAVSSVNELGLNSSGSSGNLLLPNLFVDNGDGATLS